MKLRSVLLTLAAIGTITLDEALELHRTLVDKPIPKNALDEYDAIVQVLELKRQEQLSPTFWQRFKNNKYIQRIINNVSSRRSY